MPISDSVHNPQKEAPTRLKNNPIYAEIGDHDPVYELLSSTNGAHNPVYEPPSHLSTKRTSMNRPREGFESEITTINPEEFYRQISIDGIQGYIEIASNDETGDDEVLYDMGAATISQRQQDAHAVALKMREVSREYGFGDIDVDQMAEQIYATGQQLPEWGESAYDLGASSAIYGTSGEDSPSSKPSPSAQRQLQTEIRRAANLK